MSACEKCKEWERALFLFAQLGDQSMRYSTVTCNASFLHIGLLQANIPASPPEVLRWRGMANIHTLQHFFVKQATLFGFAQAAISACASGEQWQWALLLLAGFASHSLETCQHLLLLFLCSSWQVLIYQHSCECHCTWTY